MVYDLAHRGDDCSRTAESALGKILYFIQKNLPLLNFQSQIMFCHIDQGTSGNGRQNAVGFWCYHSVVFGDKQEVGAACLFHLCSGAGIQIHIFIKTLAVGIHNGVKAHGVIQARFDMAGSIRGSAVKIADTDRQRLYTAFEIRTNRGGEYTELVFIGWFYTDDRVASEHIGADIQGSP